MTAKLLMSYSSHRTTVYPVLVGMQLDCDEFLIPKNIYSYKPVIQPNPSLIMKKNIYFLLFFFFCCLTSGFAQTYIPDKGFANAIRKYCPLCITLGDTLTAAASTQDTLIVQTLTMQSIEGIQGFTGLKTLDCSGAYLKALPPLPPNLINLQCDFNLLVDFPTLPWTLQYLKCSYNNISKLPTLPAGLTTLACNNNKLTSLPTLPKILMELACVNNQITALPNLPIYLKTLACSNNPLKTLPQLPVQMAQLFCVNNQLSSLPILPKLLTRLDCSDNQLTMLPSLPNTIEYISCRKNKLYGLPILRENLIQLDCSNNPMLSCINETLPTKLSYLSIKQTGIKCLPNQLTNIVIDTPVPICDATNSTVCFIFPRIKGKLYIDYGDDGIKNNNDLSVPLHLIEVDANTYDVTDSTGVYSLTSDINSTLVIKPHQQTLPNFELKPAQYIVTTTGNFAQSYLNYDFRLVPKGNIPDLEVSIVSGVQRPGFDGTLTITYRNIGTTILSGQIIWEKDATELLILTTPDYGNNQNNTIFSWNFTNLKPLETRIITIVNNIPATTPLGTVLKNTVMGKTSDSGEVLLVNNTDINNTTVVGSYDPNDKTADNPYIEPQEISNGKPITYTIRFQNTGNYYAERVEVQDTVSSLFDLSTLKTIATSHPSYKVSIETDRFKKGQPIVVKWTFDKIFLQDSTTNEPASHGFIRFSIAPKQGLPLGSALENKAHIYFDYNQPIVTNTSKVTVEIKVSTSTELEAVLPLRVYPNPSSELLYVETLGLSKGQLTLTNILGQVIENQSLKSQNITNFNIHSLPNGVYFLTLKTKDGTRIAKVVKQE
jgi:uncharacterized repeat protein (TIGR01451 family)